MRISCLLAVFLVAPSASAQFPTWNSATGRVVDAETGAAIPGAAITLLECDAVDQPATCRRIPRNAMPPHPTDTEGRFKITSYLGAMVYAVHISHPGYAPIQLPPYDEGALRDAYRASPASQTPTMSPLPAGFVGRRLEWGQPHYEIALLPAPCAKR